MNLDVGHTIEGGLILADEAIDIGVPTIDLEYLLKYTKRTIETPDKWTKEAWARSPKNRRCKVTSPRACKFCLSGGLNYCFWALGGRAHYQTDKAVWRANSAIYRTARLMLLDSIENKPIHMTLMKWNDLEYITHDDVIAVLDTAIANVNDYEYIKGLMDPDNDAWILMALQKGGGVRVPSVHQQGSV